jgi:EmrB/QacA subfamily drug resistance transporter
MGESVGRRWPAFAVLSLSLLMGSVDNSVLNVVLPTLARDLDAGPGQLQWAVASYLLVFGCCLLVAGRIADQHGRKRTYLVGLALFAAASCWASFSGSMPTLIAARAAMGFGAALMSPSALAIVSGLFPEPSERGRAFALWGGIIGVGFVIGPLLSGALLAHFWWGSVFLINLPVALTALVLGSLLVPDSPGVRNEPDDVPGALLSVLGVGSLLWAVIEAPVGGWWSSRTLLPLAASALILGLFLGWEARTPYPTLRPELFRRRLFSLSVLGLCLVMFAASGSLFVLTQFLQIVLKYSPLQAGLSLLPAAAAIVLGSLASAPGVRRLGVRWTLVAGLLLMSCGMGLLGTTGTDASFASLLPGIVLLGLGSGMLTAPATSTLMRAVPERVSAVASATASAFDQVSSALGVAVMGSFLPEPVWGAMVPAARIAFRHGVSAGLLVGAAVVMAGALAISVFLPEPVVAPDSVLDRPGDRLPSG